MSPNTPNSPSMRRFPEASSGDGAMADSSRPDYVASLDGLRGIAALMVAYGHAGYFGWVPLVRGAATIGVLLFFFLSGFLMGHHYLPDSLTGLPGKRALRYWAAFLLRRFLRVYPPYLFAPVFGYLLLMPQLPPAFQATGDGQGVSIIRELAKLAALKGDLGIYWTIKVEIFFYLLYPFVISVCLLFRNTTAALFLVFAALTFFKIPVPLPGQWAGFTSVFVAGAFTAVLTKEKRVWLEDRLTHPNALAAGSLLVLALVVGLTSQSNPTQQSIWKFQWLFALLFFVMFVSLIGSNGGIRRTLSSRPSLALGRVSYSLYLVHIIAYQFVVKYIPAEFRGMPIAVVVLFVLTSICYLLAEKPFLRLSRSVPVDDRIGQVVLAAPR